MRKNNNIMNSIDTSKKTGEDMDKQLLPSHSDVFDGDAPIDPIVIDFEKDIEWLSQFEDDGDFLLSSLTDLEDNADVADSSADVEDNADMSYDAADSEDIDNSEGFPEESFSYKPAIYTSLQQGPCDFDTLLRDIGALGFELKPELCDMVSNGEVNCNNGLFELNANFPLADNYLYKLMRRKPEDDDSVNEADLLAELEQTRVEIDDTLCAAGNAVRHEDEDSARLILAKKLQLEDRICILEKIYDIVHLNPGKPGRKLAELQKELQENKRHNMFGANTALVDAELEMVKAFVEGKN